MSLMTSPDPGVWKRHSLIDTLDVVSFPLLLLLRERKREREREREREGVSHTHTQREMCV